MPRPKGFEPYTNLWVVECSGVYTYSKTFGINFVVSSVAIRRTEADADVSAAYYNSLTSLANKSVNKFPIKWLNSANQIAGFINPRTVPFGTRSGLSIG
jgi:hypothetical protein